MRKKEQACQAWMDICDNCERERDYFAGTTTALWKNTLPYVKTCDEDCDKFSVATLSKDKEAIAYLYDTIELDDKIFDRMKDLMSVNNELMLTLNPFILQDKYSFLSPVYNELALDAFAQDKLLSLDDFELDILKSIFVLSKKYGVNSNNLLASIINNIGRSILPLRNNEGYLERFDKFFQMLKELDSEQMQNDNVIENIGYVLYTGNFPVNKEELFDYSNNLRLFVLDHINRSNSIDEIKDDLFLALFGINLSDMGFFVKAFDIDGISDELLMEPGVIELTAIKMIIDEEDFNKLKELSISLLNDKDFNINLFNNCLLKENILKVFAKEYNKCKPNFSEANLMSSEGDIQFYDAGNEFYSIVKTLGAFSDDGKGLTNYYDEWNDDRYRSHVNAVSLIRNDNLAFAEQDGEIHIKLGFYDFGERMFLGGGNSDINTTPDSRALGIKIYSHLSFPSNFINRTREWHNELDYERKNEDTQNPEFKKNPDFVILDQECEDISSLSIEEQQRFEEYRNNTIKAAREFGNLPVLVINREKIARNEINLINTMLENYETTHDISLLKDVIIKFNNNRNGCRGPQHTFIRENYFSNDFFQELLDRIDSIVLDEQRDLLFDFVKEEYEKMAHCLYDTSTKDLPVEARDKTKKGGLNV